MMEDDKISKVFESLGNLHYSSGPIYQSTERKKGLMYMQLDELRGIYHLTESHAPGLRYKATYRFEKNVKNETDNKYISINKQNIDFNCKSSIMTEKINKMLQLIKEMPKEWMIIQLTPQYNPNESFETFDEKCYTNSLHITVFDCGENQPKPFCVTVDTPIDKINGNIIEIRQEMASIIEDNKKSLQHFKANDKSREFFTSHVDKHAYSKIRYTINNRLKNLVKDIQDIWLKEWRCLFIGKLMDDKEDIVSEKLQSLLQKFKLYTSEKTKCILKYLIKSSGYLKMKEIKQAIQYCFPNNKELQINLTKSIHGISQNHNFSGHKRHPVILVLDEKLDSLPWEMLDVLQDHPISRMPSLHFTYALFKEHEETIVDGVKINIDYQKGKYMINPSLDLKRMETRLHSFFKFWTPYWKGLVGVTPSCEDFEKLLLNSDIFSYNGHGNGSQFFSSDKIQKLRINSVVLLFGCGSVKYTSLGPQVELYGSNQMYLIACSPCVVGMLWEVTDFDTDCLSTEFWSIWLPKTSRLHWTDIDKKKWELTGEIEPSSVKEYDTTDRNEPELLRALSKARKGARQYLTQASCVARGIPVKIKS